MKEQTARYSSNRSEFGASVQAILMSIIRTVEMKGVDFSAIWGVHCPCDLCRGHDTDIILAE